MTTPKKLSPRKLLVATLGLATVNYVAVACTPSAPPTSGNLPSPDPTAIDAAPPVVTPTPRTPPPTSGNLPAPTPRDAGRD